MKNKIAFGLALGLALAFSAASARAAATTTPDEDLILAFFANGTGATTSDYEIDLGNYANSTSININSDLATVFGTNWSTNSGSSAGLKWAVFGTSFSAATTTQYAVFLSTPNSTSPGTKSNEQTVSTYIYNNTYSFYDNAGNTAFSDGAVQTPDTTTGAFGTVNGSTGTKTLGDLVPDWGTSFLTSGNVGSGSASANLFELAYQTDAFGDPAINQKIGTVTLASNGDVTYAAVPEPSTWASLILGAAALVGFRRRRA